MEPRCEQIGGAESGDQGERKRPGTSGGRVAELAKETKEQTEQK